ncbi:MAG TPA: di-heme oxidoredictase family protein [Gammaproteobacteria bacterium]|nr:di-heme oxidoredictase family protein [Gammaproteobacteria bacterium]
MRTGIGLSTAAVLLGSTVALQANAQPQRERFRISGQVQTEQQAVDPRTGRPPPPPRFSEAPTGFDNLTNGFLPQGPDFDTLEDDAVVPLRSFNDDRFIFEEVEVVRDGLGPIYNAQSCRECHQNVATGGASQIAEHRTGHMTNGAFFESQGGSLIGSRTTHPDIQERVVFEDSIRTFRISTNTLGAGYVEAIANPTLMAIRLAQPSSMRGSIVLAPVLEAGSLPRIGRFGWKSQHASLESFAADAYLNEMGITSPLFPEENTSSGINVSYPSDYDPVPEPEDDGVDVKAFADFMRSTKAPSRGPITADVLSGETLFKNIGCATCHVPTIPTSPPGTPINGGKLVVPEALGNKLIHPYADFLMHDIGTGDGIPVQPTPELASTASQIRTAPLWALRTRNRLMHDGLTFTEREAIERHAGQATAVTQRFKALSAADQTLLLKFLDSL